MQEIKSDPLKTSTTISLGFLVIYLFTGYQWAIWTSLTVGLIGLFLPSLSQWIERAWFLLARILSYIVPNILLSAVFYLILFPVSLLSKLSKKQDHLKLKNKEQTVYRNRSTTYKASDLENMW